MPLFYFNVASLLFVVSATAIIGWHRAINHRTSDSVNIADAVLAVHAAYLAAQQIVIGAILTGANVPDLVRACMVLLFYFEPLFATVAICGIFPFVVARMVQPNDRRYASAQLGLLILGGACTVLQVIEAGRAFP